MIAVNLLLIYRVFELICQNLLLSLAILKLIAKLLLKVYQHEFLLDYGLDFWVYILLLAILVILRRNLCYLFKVLGKTLSYYISLSLLLNTILMAIVCFILLLKSMMTHHLVHGAIALFLAHESELCDFWSLNYLIVTVLRLNLGRDKECCQWRLLVS